MWKTARSPDHEGGSIPHTVLHPPGYPRYTAGRCRTIKQAVPHTAAARLHHSSHPDHIPDAAHHPRFSKQQHKLFCMLDSHGHDTAVQRLLLCMACICFFHSDTSAVKCCRFFFFYVCFLCVLLGICRSLRYLVTVLRDTLISIVLSLMTSC